MRNPSCTLCPLHERVNSVCVWGRGPAPAEIMLIGESPGYDEDLGNSPFIGRSGQKLDAFLSAWGVKDCTYITNTCKCRSYSDETGKDRRPGLRMIRTCSDAYLMTEIKKVKPELILLCGAAALVWWLDTTQKAAIKDHDMKNLNEEGDLLIGKKKPKVFVIYHPAAVLRDPLRQDHWMRQMEAALSCLDGKGFAPEGKYYLKGAVPSVDRDVTQFFLQKHEKGTPIVLDVETTGLDPWEPDGKIEWYAVSHREEFGYVQSVPGLIPRVLVDENVVKVGHNFKFDMHWLMRSGQRIEGPIFDTMVAAHVISDARSSLSLESLALSELNVRSWKELAKGGTLDPETARKYAGKDADIEYRLMLLYSKQLDKQGLMPLFQRKMKLLRCLQSMEYTGFKVDNKRRLALRDTVARGLVRAKTDIRRALGYSMENPNSSKQVTEILYGKLGCPILSRTDTGLPGTGKEALAELVEADIPDKARAFIRSLQEYRSRRVVLSTFIDGMEKHIKSDGKVHPSFGLTTSVTRLSCREPNLQNIPKTEIRSMFVPSVEGFSIISADYSQLELRIFAMLSQDANLFSAYIEGLDIHVMTAASLFDKPLHEVTEEERSKGKKINFTILYGSGPGKVAHEMGISFEAAKYLISTWYQTYPGVTKYKMDTLKFLNRNGYIEDWYGQRRHLPKVVNPFSKNANEQRVIRQAINGPVQCTAANLLCFAMLRIKEHLDKKRLPARLISTVHDEVVLECANGSVKEVSTLIKEVMETEIPEEDGITVPLQADVVYGPNWFDMVSVEEEEDGKKSA